MSLLDTAPNQLAEEGLINSDDVPPFEKVTLKLRLSGWDLMAGVQEAIHNALSARGFKRGWICEPEQGCISILSVEKGHLLAEVTLWATRATPNSEDT